MRKFNLWACLLLACTLFAGQIQAQTAGDLSFTAWNADSTDGWSFVVLANIPANTTIWFTDDEWSGTAFGTGEGDVSWVNTAMTPAGTVVDVFGAGSATPTTNIGTVAPGTNGGTNLGASGEGLYAYLGTQRTPTTFLGAITNNTWGGAAGSIAGTGLTAGTTAQELTSDVDVAQYIGTRNTLATFTAYLTPLNNIATNWVTQDGIGNQSFDGTAPDLPFDLTVFTLGATLPTPTLSLLATRIVKKENAGTVSFFVKLNGTASQAVSVDLTLTSFATATAVADFQLPAQVTFPMGAVDDTAEVIITLVDDNLAENDEYFAFELTNAVGADLPASPFATIFIQDNDRLAPAASHEINLRLLNSFSNGSSSNNSAEIVAYDALSSRLFIANSIGNKLDIVDFQNPASPALIHSIDLTTYGGINGVAAYNGTIAVALENLTNKQMPGFIAFFDTAGTFISQVTAGALPDMITFTPDGTKVLTANEGEPSADYTMDPEGSITIVDISGGVATVSQTNVSSATFTAYNAQIATLKAAGVRIFGPGATVAQDLEPEYITISANGDTAWVTLQENNAVAIVDIATATVTNVLPLGYKDHSLAGSGLDGSNSGSDILIANYPIKGAYMPDAIASYAVGGKTYLITANEGDSRDYAAYSEESSIGASAYVLDPTAFPNGNLLKAAIGPLKTTLASGDTDNDGDYDEIVVFGGRSFTIWNGATGAALYDSGDDEELIIAQDPVYSAIFNCSNTNITRKNRSDDKGPEPEGVIVGEINGQQYAFVGLERVGGVMVYNVTNPATPRFVQYINPRSTTSTNGDRGAEGVIFIPADKSPSGKNILITANEISSTLSIFEIDAVQVASYDLGATPLVTSYNGIDIYEGGFSGLTYIPGSDLEFYTHGDRGPNADASNNPLANGATALVFPDPNYAPKIHRIKAEADTIRVVSTLSLRRPDSTTTTGLPLPAGQGGTGEIAWSDNIGTVAGTDLWGIDPEGIVEGPDGTFWICEEYGTTVWNVEKATGRVINRYNPYGASANNLPIDTVFQRRRPNRGFEGVAFTPNGKVYAMIQSVIYNPSASVANASRLHRLVEIDPLTGATRMFGYEHDAPVGGSTGIRNSDWKIGDMVAINNFEMLVIEHAERGSENEKNIYKIDIRNATPITTDNFGGSTFEGLLNAANALTNGISLVNKTAYASLLDLGWDLQLDKPEGLTIINDTTFAVVNDNDFGINSPAADGTIVATGRPTRLYVYTVPATVKTPMELCLPVSLSVPTTQICASATVTLSAPAVAGATYTWFRDGVAISNAPSNSFAVSQTGAYRLEIASTPTCDARTNTVMIDVVTPPAINLGQDSIICLNASIVLQAPSGFQSYAWSTGQTTANVTLTGASLGLGLNVVKVTGTTAEGCTSVDSVTITVDACSGIESLTALSLQAFPNPSHDWVNLQVALVNSHSATLLMTNASGQVLSRRQLEVTAGIIDTRVDLSELASGIYFLQVVAGEKSGVIRVAKY